MKLENNVIFITGATSGIGRALAEELHNKGNKVIISGRRKHLLEAVKQANPGMDSVELDINDDQSITQAAEYLKANYPTLNVLINNAGVMPFDDITKELKSEDLDSLIKTNFTGPILLTSKLIDRIKEQTNPVIVYNSSVLAFVPLADNAVYSATKAAIHSYVLSQRFKFRNTNLKVLEIAPPWVDTDLIYKSGDSRAMPLNAFIAETIELLATDKNEIIVSSALGFRENPGANEHAFVTGFNEAVAENPIPVH